MRDLVSRISSDAKSTKRTKGFLVDSVVFLFAWEMEYEDMPIRLAVGMVVANMDRGLGSHIAGPAHAILRMRVSEVKYVADGTLQA